MKFYISEGCNVTQTAPRDLASGDGCLIGSLFGVVEADAISGDPVVLVTFGIFQLAKTAGEAWTEGQVLYWDDSSAKSLTTTAGSNKRVGTAHLVAGSDDTVGQIRLDGAAV